MKRTDSEENPDSMPIGRRQMRGEQASERTLGESVNAALDFLARHLPGKGIVRIAGQGGEPRENWAG
jgi:hypothetical protein